MNEQDAKLRELEQRIQFLESEVAMLKRQENRAPIKITQPTISAVEQNNHTTNSKTNQNTRTTPYKDNTPLENIGKKDNSSTNSTPSGLEALIGKNVIGVLASILIFIALILFGSMFYLEAGEFGKTCILFLGSSAITVVGFLLYKKMKNTFSLSIVSCGMGCFYLTFIVCNLFFQWLPDIPLYLCLFLWIMCMGYLCRKMNSKLLCAIGQCGLSLAVFLGIASVGEDAFLWLSIVIFFVAATCLYFYICRQTPWTRFHLLSHIASLVTLLIIGYCNYDFSYYAGKYTDVVCDKWYIYIGISIVLFLFPFYLLWKSYKDVCEEDNIPRKRMVFHNLFTTVCSFYFFALIGNDLLESVSDFYIAKHFSAICILLFNLATGIWMEYKYQQYNTTKHAYDFITGFWMPVLLFSSILCLFSMNLSAYGTLLLLCIPLFVYGIQKGNPVYSICGLCVLGLFIPTGCKFPFLHLAGIIAPLVYFLFLIKKYAVKNGNAYKITCYFFLLLSSGVYIADVESILSYFSIDLSFDIYMFLTFCIAAVLQIVALHSPLIEDWEKKGEQHKTLEHCISIINILLLFFGTTLLYLDFSLFIYLILVAFTAFLCFMRLRDFLKQHGHQTYAGVWVGLKCTIYIYAVLKSTSIKTEIIFSIALLLIAILAILVGFWLNTKSLRMYGLGLTMISIFKLLLIDVSYSNLMEVILAFLVCGVLCFVINYIYNRLSKKLLEK